MPVHREHYKLDLPTIRQIKDLYETGEYTHRKLGEMFGVHQSNITRAINDQSFQQFKEA